jgi:hypothetical protein
MSKNKSNEVAVQDNLADKALAIQADAQERALALKELGVEATDLVIPSIQLMQGTSALVGEDKAKLGEIVNMQTEEIIGGIDKAVKILPLKLYKTLRTYDVTNNGFKFMSEDPLTAANEKLQGEGVVEGVPVKRYQTLNFFVLLKTDLDKGEGFPCLLRFRSTGMNAGRALATHLYKRVFFKAKPYSQFVELSSRKEKKDTATYAVFNLSTKAPENASADHVQNAETWLAMLAAGNYKLDEREDGHDEDRAGAAKPVVVDSNVVGEDLNY